MDGTRRVPAVALVAGAAASGLTVAAAFRADLRAARDRLAGESRLVPTRHGPVELAESGSGPPVLVSHGTAGGFDMGLRLGRDVFGGRYRVLAPSRFGYLRTPMPAGATHAAQAETFAALLDALDVPRAAVVGVSGGAPAAVRLALRHPGRVPGLVLLVPALHVPVEPDAPPASGPPDVVLDHILGSDLLVWVVRRLAPGLLLRVAGVPPALLRRVPTQMRGDLLDGFLPASERHAGMAFDLRETVPNAPDLPIERLAMPVLLVGVADDPYRSAEVVHTSAPRIPHVTPVVLGSGGHVMVGQGDVLRDTVRGFLRGTW